MGITGNERADQAAKLASSDGQAYKCLPLYTDHIQAIKRKCRVMWQTYFDERSQSKGIWYRTIQSELPCYPWFHEMRANREHIVTLLRLRSGHIPSNKFSHLMGKTESPNCLECNKIDDVQHVLAECSKNQSMRIQVMCPDYNIGVCNSILASPLSEEARKLCVMYRLRL